MTSADSGTNEKRRDPIVGRFATTDIPLIAILQNSPAALLSPVARALLGILECLNGKRLAMEAIQAAQQVSLQKSDPELLILMLGAWAELSCRIGRPSEAQSFLHRAQALVSEQTHPEVRAHAMMVESIVADTTGNQGLREKTVQDILDLLPAFSPRRKFYLWEKAFLLAQQGRGMDFGDTINEMTWQCNERFPLCRVQLVQFIDHVERGNVENATSQLPSIVSERKRLGGMEVLALRNGQAILKLMQGGISPEMLPGAKKANEIPHAARIAYSLILKDKKEALRLARMEAQKMRGSILGTGFESYSLIRAELAAGNADSAIRILRAREARGNSHYLDDFFFARAQLLLSERKEAVQRFARLLEATHRFKAKPRLDFEMKLACELEEGNVLWLTQEAAKLMMKPTAADHADPMCGDLVRPMPFPHDAANVSPPGMAMILGSSTAISAIRETITRFADIDAPVLVTGETGTGKDLVARALHECSRRRTYPFTPVNCGSLTETLLESELFGHERGAFTGAEKAAKGLFEETGHGTILLDEIGDISPRLQATLLRVLETGEIRAVGSSKTRQIHCRIIAATNVDLEELAAEKHFRKDLFFRLQRLLIHIQPLRERRADIPLLARHFLDSGRRIGIHATLTKELRDALRAYDWPGNVRELKNVIERMRLMHSDKLAYGLEDLDAKLRNTFRNTPKDELRPHRPPTAHQTDRPPGNAAVTPPSQTDDADAASNPRPAQHIKAGKSMLRRLDRLKALFEEHKKLTRGEIVQIMGISANTATKYLQDLCDAGIVRRIEPTASTRSHYFILDERLP